MGSVSFVFFDWLVFLGVCKGPVVFGRNNLSPSLVQGRGDLG